MGLKYTYTDKSGKVIVINSSANKISGYIFDENGMRKKEESIPITIDVPATIVEEKFNLLKFIKKLLKIK